MKKQIFGSLLVTMVILLSLSVILCFPATGYAVPETYTFEDYDIDGSSDAGFSSIGNTFLISEDFYPTPWGISYDVEGRYLDGIIIKPDGENLASFDLENIEFWPGEYINGSFFAKIDIEATLNNGSTVTQSVNKDFGSVVSLTDEMNMSPFDNVTQLSFTIDTTDPRNDENPFLPDNFGVWDIVFNSITIEDANPPPEMRIEWYGTNLEIPDGDTSPRSEDGTYFGSVDVTTGRVVRAFDIENTGSGRLTLTDASPYVTLTGDTSDFSLFEFPENSSIPGGEIARFKIAFNPTTTGTKTATVSIANDDADENPYTFNIQGNGYEKAKVLNVTATNTDGSYGDEAVINISVLFDKTVNVDGGPRLALETGSTDAVAGYVSGTGTNTLMFRYTVDSNHRSSDLSYKGSEALYLNGGAIRDSDDYDALLALPDSGESGSLSYNKNLYIITPGFLITESGSGTLVGESGLTDTFTVVLIAQPDSDVVINISSDDLTEAMVDKSVLTFTSGTWNTAQTVTVMGVNDSRDDGNIVSTIKLSIDDGASDDHFDGLLDKAFSVTTVDNDTAGFGITETAGNTIVDESGTTDTFSVVLTAKPDSDVVINLVSGDTGEATVNSSGLTFTNVNWNTAQIVTITGVDDWVFDGSQYSIITISVNDGASDNSFDSLDDQTVGVTTTDDEVDTDKDGIPDQWEINHGLDPNNPDDDEVDDDGDGLSNLDEYQYGTDPNEEDSDGDGLSDEWEIENGYDPTITDSDSNDTDDGEEDPDNDGINNIFEEMLGLEPDNADSDGDDIADGDEDPDGDGITTIVEIARGLNPIVNELPSVVIAQPEQTIEEDVEVTLDGLGSSDPDDGISTYLWTQITGLDTIITITDADQAVASFISPQVDAGGESFKFSLTVEDKAGQSSSSTCIVNVTWSNVPPVANAGIDDEVIGGDMVQLDGSGSVDSDGEIVSYLWEQVEGTEVEDFVSTSVTPFFTAPNPEEDETLVFRLTVTDQEGLESVDFVEIEVPGSGGAPGPEPEPKKNSDSSGCFIKSAFGF